MKAEGCCIGLTGGIACGKSEVAKIFEEEGFALLDTDRIGHDCLAAGSSCMDRLREVFPEELFDSDGSVNRKRMGDLVFEDPNARESLNAIVHPEISRRWRRWREARKLEGQRCCVTIPLLFEVGAVDGWDAVVAVVSERTHIRQRLLARGLDENQAEQRIRAQMLIEEKAAKADVVIENNGSLQELRTRTLEAIARLAAGGEHHGRIRQ